MKEIRLRNYLKTNWPAIVLIVFAILTRFLFLNYPAEVVFDEVHFGKFVSAYFSHQYYFDIHPPLGKLMIAGFSKLFGYRGNFGFSQIGESFDAKNLFILRFLPALFGAFFVILIYEFILVIGLSKKAAFLGGFLVLFDNAYLVQSRFILVDIFLIFFGFSALYVFVLAEKLTGSSKKQLILYAISAVFAGLSFSVKWTGLSFLGMILFFIFLDFLKNRGIKDFFQKTIIFILLSTLIYILSFYIHFSLLRNSGPGDPFMSPSFQKTLSGNKIGKEVKASSFWGKFIELNIAKYKYNAGIKTGHPDASKWYEWPLMKKPIWYWTKNSDERAANIYFLGNPLTWWLVLFSVISSIFFIFLKQFRKKFSPLIYFLIFGYFVNLLPFVFISRVSFLYHYLPSLTFGMIILVFLYDKIFDFQTKTTFYFGFLTLFLLIFLLFMPLTYGFSLPVKINKLYELFVKFLK